MIFLLNIVINILCSVGAFPPAASFLPFFSLGTSNILLCYALAGIVMSVYRYKDIYPRDVSEEIRMKKRVDWYLKEWIDIYEWNVEIDSELENSLIYVNKIAVIGKDNGKGFEVVVDQISMV